MAEHQLPKLSVEGSIPFARSISAIVLIEDLEALARRLRHLDRQGVRCGVKMLLTHHARAPLAMAGGTVFHFVTEGIHAALAQARAAAGGRDVRIGGGASAIRQYLRAALIDELHLVMSPVLLGAGEHLMQGIDLRALGYTCTKCVAGERATHVMLQKRT